VLLLFVKVVTLRSVALHGDKEISEGVLEGLPIVECVEKLDHEGLNLHLVHVSELEQQVGRHILADELLVRGHGVRLILVRVQLSLWVYDDAIGVDSTQKLVDDHRLHFEAAYMAVIDHYSESLAQDLAVHELVEVSGKLGEFLQDDSHCMHRLETQIHQLWLLVLHGKNDDVDDVLEHGLV
jgi:hypothetical protein